jgi:cyclophilin family peptidyl-prolyl cis-trans isomerase
VVALFGISNFTGSGDSNSASDTTEVAGPPTLETLPGRQITGATPCPKTDGTEERATIFEKAPTMCIDAKKSYTATFDTTEGEIVVALDTKNTPNTVNNFVTLSNYGYYNKSYIFRTDPSLDIIQGGGASNTDDPGYTIKDEGADFTYSPGDLVMARSPGENSGGGQFFFVTGPKASVLDSQGKYVTFGKVTSGLDITQKILGLNSGEGDLGGAPSRAVEIRSITITAK